jgi:Phage integrase, N-terminal SAM-like domain
MGTTNTVSPLRQRMIEDMTARKLGPNSQRSHIHSCRRFAAFLKRSPDTATADDVRRFQLYLVESGLGISNRNRIMTGVKFLFRVTLRLPPPRTPEPAAHHEPQRGGAAACHGRQPQGPRDALPRLWLWASRRRDRPAQSWRHRQRADDHPDRAVERVQGPARHVTAYPTLCLHPYSGRFFAFLQNALAWPPTPITPISPSHIILSPLWATVDATKSP